MVTLFSTYIQRGACGTPVSIYGNRRLMNGKNRTENDDPARTDQIISHAFTEKPRRESCSLVLYTRMQTKKAHGEKSTRLTLHFLHSHHAKQSSRSSTVQKLFYPNAKSVSRIRNACSTIDDGTDDDPTLQDSRLPAAVSQYTPFLGFFTHHLIGGFCVLFRDKCCWEYGSQIKRFPAVYALKEPQVVKTRSFPSWDR